MGIQEQSKNVKRNSNESYNLRQKYLSISVRILLTSKETLWNLSCGGVIIGYEVLVSFKVLISYERVRYLCHTSRYKRVRCWYHASMTGTSGMLVSIAGLMQACQVS